MEWWNKPLRVLLATRRTVDLTFNEVAKQFISGWKSKSLEDSFSTQIFSDDFTDPDNLIFLQAKGIRIWETPTLGERTLAVVESWGRNLASFQNQEGDSSSRKKILIGEFSTSLILGYPKLENNEIENIFIQLLLAPLAFLRGIYRGVNGESNPLELLDLYGLKLSLKALLQDESNNQQAKFKEFWQRITKFIELCRPLINRIVNSRIMILLQDNSNSIDLVKLWPALMNYPGAIKAISIYEKIHCLIKGKETQFQLPIVGQAKRDDGFSLAAKEISGWGVARLLTNLGLQVYSLKIEICDEINTLLNTQNKPDLIVCNTDSLSIWEYPYSLFEELVKVAGRYGVPVILWGSNLNLSRRDIMEMGFAGIYQLNPGRNKFIVAGSRTAVTWARKTVS